MIETSHPQNRSGQRILGIELRLRSVPSAADWRRGYDQILAWQPGLHPSLLYRNSDSQAVDPEPWREDLIPSLADGLAELSYFSWMLYRPDIEDQRLTFRRMGDEIGVSIAFPWGGDDLPVAFINLIDRLQACIPPSLGMLFDANTEDAEVIQQGLSGLKNLPALLYVNAVNIHVLGGIDHLRRAPCPYCKRLEGDACCSSALQSGDLQPRLNWL